MDAEHQHDDAYRGWLVALGRRLAHHRRALGLTQAAAAERCGMDLKHYQDAEYGRRALGTRALFTISTVLGAQMAKLVDGEVPKDYDARGIADLAPELAALGWQLFVSKPRGKRACAPAVELLAIPKLAGGLARPRFWAMPPDRTLVPQGSFLLDLQSATESEWCGWALCRPGLPAGLLGAWVVFTPSPASLQPELALARVVALAQDDAGYQITLRGATPGAEEWRQFANKLEGFDVVAHVCSFLARSPAAGSAQADAPQRTAGPTSLTEPDAARSREYKTR